MLIDQPLTLRFDQRERTEFVQGEDRQMEVSVFTAGMVQPVDVMLHKSFAVHFPRQSGGTIKRRMAPVTFALNVTQQPEGSLLAAPGHGFVTGDTAKVTGPAPFDAEKVYTLIADTAETLRFLDDAQSPVIIPNGQSDSVTIAAIDAVTFKPQQSVANTVVVNLPAHVTQEVGDGMGQDVQAVIIDDNGLVRIVLGRQALDVFRQPLP